MRAGGLINGSVSGGVSADLQRGIMGCSFPPVVLHSLLRRASVTDNYRQFKLGHGTQCVHATKSAASTTTTQLNSRHRFAKQQSATKIS